MKYLVPDDSKGFGTGDLAFYRMLGEYVGDIPQQVYSSLYPGQRYIPSLTLEQMRIIPKDTEHDPVDIDLSVEIGPVKMNTPMISSPMDMVTESDMMTAMHLAGGCGIGWRRKKHVDQINDIRIAINKTPCLVEDPVTLGVDATVKDAQEVLDEHHRSTIPIVGNGGKLLGIIFTKVLDFTHEADQLLTERMVPFSELSFVETTDYHEVRIKFGEHKGATVLPVIEGGAFKGLFFKKDVMKSNPSFHNGKPLVGMAIGVHEEDLIRAEEALELGVGMIVIDSSHGNCVPVLAQAARIIKMSAGRAAIIVGNIVDIDGCVRAAILGSHAVRSGIGPGSICTTTLVTGAGLGQFTATESQYTVGLLIAKMMKEDPSRFPEGTTIPKIITDGGIETTGDIAVALAAGAHLVMMGKYFCGAAESASAIKHGIHKDPKGAKWVKYRGMASKEAIDERSNDRYSGGGKMAPEGESGFVPYKGPLRDWLLADLQGIKSGFGHLGAGSVEEAHERGVKPYAFTRFDPASPQIPTRLMQH